MRLKGTILCLFISITMLAQEHYQVFGTVLSEKGKAISFANCLLLAQKDSSIVKGVSTNDKGEFNFNNVPNASYILKVTFIGYKTHSQKIVVNKNLEVKDIFLKVDNESLKEVNINTRKPSLKREVDRLIFNVENTALVEGNTWEVLQRTPGLLIIDNNITIKNNTPTIYINDRRVYLSSDEIYQLLEGTPAHSLKSIEVITNPPAKYDAEGGSVLNIVMSKNVITGYHGSVYGNYTQGVYPRYNGGMSHFYKKNKINIYANYGYTHNKINRENDEDINYLEDNDVRSIWSSDIDRNTWSNRHNFNTIIDYNIDDNNTLSFSGNLSYLPYWNRLTLTHTDIDDITATDEDFTLSTFNRTNDDSHNLGMNLDYEHTFKKEGERLSVNFHHTDYEKDRSQRVLTDYFRQSDGFTENTQFTTDAQQQTKIFTGQVDYELPLENDASFEAGAKTAFITTDSDINYFNVIGGTSVFDTTNSDEFDYKENIFAAYVSYAKEWEKWSLKLGLRGEQTNVEGRSISTVATNNQDYFELFPSAYITHTVSDDVNVYVNYSRNINRPNYKNLNPFRFFFSDFSFFSGNPNLRPSISNSIYLGTEIKEMFFVELFYSNSKNEIYELILQDNANDIIQYIPTNVDNNNYYGIDFISYFSLTGFWDTSITFSLYNNEDTFSTPDEGIEVTRSRWSTYSLITNNFTFLKDKSLTSSVSFNYNSPIVFGFAETKARNNLMLDIRKTILNKKAVISLSFNDILNGQKSDNTIIYANQNNRYRATYDFQTVKLGFRYKFGNTKLRTNQKQNSSDERDRLEE